MQTVLIGLAVNLRIGAGNPSTTPSFILYFALFWRMRSFACACAGTGSNVGSAGGSARGSLRAGRNEDMEHVALLTTNLALKFIFMVRNVTC